MPTYTLNIVVQGHDRGAASMLHGTSAALANLGNVGNLVGSIFGAGLLLRAFDALSAALGNITRSAIEAAGNFQMLQIQMQGLLAVQAGTEDMAAAMAAAAGPARALLDWIADFAVKTPFTVQVLSEMVRDFLAMGMGIEPTKRLTTALGNLGSGLGLTEWQLQRVIWNLTQTTRSMKITERDIREFGNAGIPVNLVLDQMAKKMGTTRAAALEFAKSGEAGVAAWTEALEAVAEEHFPDAMDNIAKTWNVAKSNIKDVIESIFGKEVLGPALGKAGELLSGWLNTVLARRMDFRALGEQLAGVFGFLVPRVQGLLGSLGDLGRAVLGLFGIDVSNLSLRQSIYDLALLAGNLLTNGQGVVDWLAGLPAKIQAGLAGNETVQNFLGSVDRALGSLGAWWTESGQGFVDGLGSIGTGLLGIAQSGAETALSVLGGLLETAARVLKENGPAINNFLLNLGTFLQQNGDTLVGFAAGLGTVLVIAKGLGAASAGVAALGVALSALFTPVVLLAVAVGVLVGLLVDMGNKLVPADIAEKLNWWQKAIGALAVLSTTAGQLIVIVSYLANQAMRWLTEKMIWLVEHAPDLWKQLWSGETAAGALAAALGRVAMNIQRVIDSLPNLAGALAAVSVPWWLVGHSPSPLETWLTGIAAAFDDVARAAPGAFGPRPAFAFAPALPPGGGAAPPITVILRDPVVRQEQDLDRLTRMVIEGIRREMR